MDVGDVLAGRYELLDQIGVGGMGRVLRARDRTLDRIVAVKLLAPHLLGDEDAVAALRGEARRAGSVRHPNVVQVLDAVLDATDQPAIVMEHVDGPSLAATVPEHGMPVEEALAILGAVGAGLAAVHEAGLVHRDVTPSNVLLDEGVPRLTDFGIARSAAATATQTVRGSVGYLAPEQASGTRVGPAADVYALGCLATTLLTGRPPFAADTAVGVVHQHLHTEPPDLRVRRPDVPEAVATAVAAALAKAPGDRPRDVLSLLQQLGTHAGRRTDAPVSAAPAAAAAATTVIPPRSTTRVVDAAPGVDEADDPGRRPSAWALVAAGALLLGVPVALALTGTEESPAVMATPTTAPAAAAATTSPSSNPSPTASPSPSPTASPTEQALAALHDLRRLVLDLEVRGELEVDASRKLGERAADAGEKLRAGKPQEAGKKLDELRRDLDDQVRDERASPTARRELVAVVAQLDEALDGMPTQGDDDGRGDDAGDDKDEKDEKDDEGSDDED